MRNLLLFVPLLLLQARGLAQTKWHHELLNTRIIQMEGRLDVFFRVNPSNIPIYTAQPIGYPGMHAWRGTESLNDTYLAYPSQGKGFQINRAGEVAYTALTLSSLKVMVEGTDYFEPIFGKSKNYSLFIGGLSQSGIPLWLADDSTTHVVRIFYGLDELTEGRQYFLPKPLKVNEKGDALWTGYYEENGQDIEGVFVNKTDVSTPLLGGNAFVLAADMNDSGDVIFAGTGDNFGLKQKLFLNGVNITDTYGIGMLQVNQIRLSNSGHYLWHIMDPDRRERLMFDHVDLSRAVLGDVDYGIYQGELFINDAGDVGWTAQGDSFHKKIFRNKIDVSTNAIGFPYAPYAPSLVGIDGMGNVAWSGGGPLTNNKYEAFVNDFSISRDALKDQPYGNAYALAIGANGAVLWYSNYAGDGFAKIWLSTPVPEPSAFTLLGIGLIGYLIRRRSKP